MIVVVQRVEHAQVAVEGKIVGQAGKGCLLLIGVASGDTYEDADVIIKKIPLLRIFTDSEDKMNLSLTDIGGEVLAISNFTLLGNCRRGNRPDYMGAEKPDEALNLYQYFVEKLRKTVNHVATGVFGADMRIESIADGPVTIILDSKALRAPRSGGAS